MWRQWLCKIVISRGAQSEPLRAFVVFSQKAANMCVFSLIGDMISSKHSSKWRILKLRYQTWKWLACETYFVDLPCSLKWFKTETRSKIFFFWCSLFCFQLFNVFDTTQIFIDLRRILQFQADQFFTFRSC